MDKCGSFVYTQTSCPQFLLINHSCPQDGHKKITRMNKFKFNKFYTFPQTLLQLLFKIEKK